MKIQLERKLKSCPDTLRCIVCHQPFQVGHLRSLIYNRHNLIEGDACPQCMTLQPTLFQQKLRNQANRLMQEVAAQQVTCRDMPERAVELLALSEEPVQFPTFWERWFKHMALWATETRELEIARLGLSSGCPARQWTQSGHKPSRIQIHLADDEIG